MKLDDKFREVRAVMEYAKLVAFDGCHKIYAAMDDEQAAWFQNNYPHWFRGTPEEMTKKLRGWFEESCSLRFIQTVTTSWPDANEGFVSLIDQLDSFDDEEACVNCGDTSSLLDGEGFCGDCGRDFAEDD